MHTNSIESTIYEPWLTAVWWVVTKRTLKNHKTVKIGEGGVGGWRLHEYGHLLGTILYIPASWGSNFDIILGTPL